MQKFFDYEHFYKLLDFGSGRRLERFGNIVLDRPCPSAKRVSISDLELWKLTDARFEETFGSESGERGFWSILSESGKTVLEGWTISLGPGPVRMELKGTPFGHIGIFPEQLENWNRIAEYFLKVGNLKLLNLFGYTGASTLAAAVAGAETTHLDAAKNVVQWGRRNAELSGLAEAPIRWIAEDARKFVKRELKRGNHYDAIILDPPSYGHGSHGEVWRIHKHLPCLLAGCLELIAGSDSPFLLLSCHTTDYEPYRLEELIGNSFGKTNIIEMNLQTETEKTLQAGIGIILYTP